MDKFIPSFSEYLSMNGWKGNIYAISIIDIVMASILTLALFGGASTILPKRFKKHWSFISLAALFFAAFSIFSIHSARIEFRRSNKISNSQMVLNTADAIFVFVHEREKKSPQPIDSAKDFEKYKKYQNYATKTEVMFKSIFSSDISRAIDVIDASGVESDGTIKATCKSASDTYSMRDCAFRLRKISDSIH